MAEKRKRWFEANEIDVDPESGYIQENPPEIDPKSGYIGGTLEPVVEENPEDLGSIEGYKTPAQANAVDYIRDQPSYFEAWQLFTSIYNDRNADPAVQDAVLSSIPHGSGSFEGWWVGTERPEPGKVPSPEKKITKRDIDELLTASTGFGDEGSEVLSLFMNTYYNSNIGKAMDLDTLTYLVKKALRIAGRFDGTDSIELEFPAVFDALDEEERQQIWQSPAAIAAIAPRIAQEIKRMVGGAR